MRRNRTSDYSHPTLTCLVRIKARTKAPRRFSEDEWTSLLKSSLRRTRFSYSDQPIGIDLGRIELDLNLYILGDRYKRSAHLFDQHFTRFVQRIDIGVVAVSSVRKFFRASNPSNFRYRSPARSERHGFLPFPQSGESSRPCPVRQYWRLQASVQRHLLRPYGEREPEPVASYLRFIGSNYLS